VLEGHIQESLFRLDPNGGPLIEGKCQVYGPGQVAYIHDEIAVHEIRSGGGTAGVSLHLYSRPIKTCRVFDRGTGRIERRELGYHSVHGVVGAEVP
jgi:cysteine dioxygenase